MLSAHVTLGCLLCQLRYLPVLQLVTLATTPATALYAIAGLLSSPVIIPLLIIKNIITSVLFAPLVRFLHNTVHMDVSALSACAF